ncbi:MAG: iron-sulfur cluster assembly scaffold protein [Pseudomonadota bacterium]
MASAQTDLIALYSTRILALAADIPHLGRLPNPHATATCKSPQCGSQVTVDIELQGDTISNFAQDVKACALGQAAAAVFGQHIIGCTRAKVALAHQQLHQMLIDKAPPPDAPFADFVVLTPAQDFKNRHASILLTTQATLAAFDTF